MASLLFIAPADLGETVLATSALDAAMRPGDQIAIVCGADAAPLFRALPGLTSMHTIRDNASAWRLWLALAGRRFDCVIDARGAPLTRVVRARRRIAPKPAHILRHRVEDWTDWMGAEMTLAPKLWLDDPARDAAAKIAPGAEALLVLAPGGVSPAKRWPAEGYAAVARRLFDGPLAGARVVLLGAAERDAELTRTIAKSLEADGIAALDLGAKPDLLTAAALLERATLCIGNDNALAHISAAMGAPTLTLFGSTDERVRAPWGKRARTLRGREYEAIIGLPALEGSSALEDISVDAVEAEAQILLRAGGLR